MRRVPVAAVVGLFAVLVLATASLAAEPTIRRIEVNRTGPDPFLTEACGFPVQLTRQGHIIRRDFPDVDHGLVTNDAVNLTFTYSANGNEVTLRNVGADVTRIAPDGTVITLSSGQAPFDFIGAIKLDVTDPDNPDVILEPHPYRESVEEVCAALAA
jgi:hypothetical protein